MPFRGAFTGRYFLLAGQVGTLEDSPTGIWKNPCRTHPAIPKYPEKQRSYLRMFLQFPIGVQQLGAVGQQVIDLIHKGSNDLWVKFAIEWLALVEISDKIHATLLNNLLRSVLQGKELVTVSSGPLVHGRTVA